MRLYLIDNRQPVESMFRANNASRNLRLLSPEFISVGEWSEVDADRTPGWNSEGGIGVVVSVQGSRCIRRRQVSNNDFRMWLRVL
jgi:hypothetical protein